MNKKPPLRAAILVTLCLLASFEVNADDNAGPAGTPLAGADAVTRLLMYHHYPELQAVMAPDAGPGNDPVALNSLADSDPHALHGQPSIFKSDNQ